MEGVLGGFYNIRKKGEKTSKTLKLFNLKTFIYAFEIVAAYQI